jgi:hypothetical protein
MEFIKGEVAFSNLTEHEVFKGESTGKYTLVVTVDDDAVKKLEEQGVHLKTHDGKKQRKFGTRYEFQYEDTEKKPVSGELGRGSKVMVAYKLGAPYGQYGVTTFLQGVQVIERAEAQTPVDVFTVSADDVPDDNMPF